MALIPCLLLAAADAHGGDKEDAEKHFKAGVSLQKVEDFEAAIAAFESSLRLYPSKGTLFNLANCLRATHRYGEALEALQRLDREYGEVLDEPMRAAVDRQLQELRNLSASLVVQVDQAGAEVLVDGKLVGRTPLTEALQLSPGNHSIEVRLEGFEPARVQVEIVSREKTTKQIVLKKVAPPPPPPPPPPPANTTPDATPAPAPPPLPPAEGTGPLTTAGWTTGIAGVAALAGGAVTGIWALSLDGELTDACNAGSCPADRSADIDRLGTLTTTTNVLLGLGATMTAAGIVMLLIDQPTSPQEDDSTLVGLSLGPGLFGAAWGQRF
jgi:hypothetical protein